MHGAFAFVACAESLDDEDDDDDDDDDEVDERDDERGEANDKAVGAVLGEAMTTGSSSRSLLLFKYSRLTTVALSHLPFESRISSFMPTTYFVSDGLNSVCVSSESGGGG
jgi:hypothetical protein